jgi:hypothetical protein
MRDHTDHGIFPFDASEAPGRQRRGIWGIRDWADLVATSYCISLLTSRSGMSGSSTVRPRHVLIVLL